MPFIRTLHIKQAPVIGLLITGLLATLPAWAEKVSISEIRDVSPDENIRIEVMRGDVIILGVKNRWCHRRISAQSPRLFRPARL